MEQTSRNLSEDTNKKTNMNNSPLVEVTRTFNAPADRVFQAWSNQEKIKQWWGPEEFTCSKAAIAFREGGKYLCAMRGPDGKDIWSGGEYEEIIPNKRIVCTDNFTDEKGNVVSADFYGMPGDWPETLRITVNFEQLSNNQTKMSLRHEGIPADMHDDCVKGWDSSFNKLQRVVERKTNAA